MNAANHNRETWTVKKMYNWMVEYFQNLGIESAKNDTIILLQHALNIDKPINLFLYFDKPLGDDELSLIRDYVKKRKKRMPVQYIVKHTKFFDFDIYVNENVLIPRPETELLAEKSLQLLRGRQVGKILDLCCGSGVLAIYFADKFPKAEIFASDICPGAIEVAGKNIGNNAAGNVSLVQGDLFENVPKTAFDFIVCNPPYIEADVIDTLEIDVKDYEPRQALSGGEDGLDFYRRILNEIGDYMHDGTVIAFEIGYNQKEEITSMIREKNFKFVNYFKDYSEFNRVIAFSKTDFN